MDEIGDGQFSLEFNITEQGPALVTFCPLCRAQLFGQLYDAIGDDLAAHMNAMHPLRGAGQ